MIPTKVRATRSSMASTLWKLKSFGRIETQSRSRYSILWRIAISCLPPFREKCGRRYSRREDNPLESSLYEGHARTKKGITMKTSKKITTEEFERRFDAGEDISDLVDWSKGKRLHRGNVKEQAVNLSGGNLTPFA